MSVKGARPTSAVPRPADADQSSVPIKQQNGSVDGRQPAGVLTDTVSGLHQAVLYVLGEKTQMKVHNICCLHHSFVSAFIMETILFGMFLSCFCHCRQTS